MAEQDFVALAISKVHESFQVASANAKRQQFAETYAGIGQGMRAVASALTNANTAAKAATGAFDRNSKSCIECRSGCSACCYQPVMATEAEVLLVANYVQLAFDAEAAAQVRSDVREYADRLREMGGERAGRTNQRCPMLRDGKCSVYAARPFSCVMYNSTSRATCETQFALGERGEKDLGAIPVPALPIAVVGSMRDGFYAACVQRKLPMKSLNLALGLEIALNTPDALTRWMAGEDVFAQASMATLAKQDA